MAYAAPTKKWNNVFAAPEKGRFLIRKCPMLIVFQTIVSPLTGMATRTDLAPTYGEGLNLDFCRRTKAARAMDAAQMALNSVRNAILTGHLESTSESWSLDLRVNTMATLASRMAQAKRKWAR